MSYADVLRLLPERPLNLGQVVGAGLLEMGSGTPVVKLRERNERHRAILTLAASQSVTALILAERFEMGVVAACKILSKLHDQGLLTREGQHGSYSYAKARA